MIKLGQTCSNLFDMVFTKMLFIIKLFTPDSALLAVLVALYKYGLYNHGVYKHGLYIHGLYKHGLYKHVFYKHGL